MNPLRLCFIGPANSVTTRRWVEWFAARGHDTTLLTVEPAADSDLKGLRQITLAGLHGTGKLARLLAVGHLAIMLRRLKPDVVHAHYLRGLAWGLLLARPHPCVVTPWGSDVLEEQGAFREWYSRGLTRALIDMADLVTVHSGYMEEQVRALLPSLGRLARIGWGLNLTLFRPGLDAKSLRMRWQITPNQRVILSPRLAQPVYNHERVIRALPSVIEKVPEALLVIPEQHPDRNYVAQLRQISTDLGVGERVRFIGAIPYSEMPIWYNLADAAVMVPLSDGMPNSLLEAMACGAIPIMNRLPQYKGLIQHGVNGLLVDPDSGDLAGALISVLCDPGLRERIGQTNRAAVMELADQDKEMARMEGLYAQLASCRGGAS